MTASIPNDIPESLAERLTAHGQTHLVAFWDELTASDRDALVRQLQAIDYGHVDHLVASLVNGGGEEAAGGEIEPAAAVEKLPKTVAERTRWDAAGEQGLRLLETGKVACMVVAGGQGSRLGFEQPKGMFPIGPVSGKSLFQLHFEQLEALSTRVGQRVPYFIMTSEATDGPTKDFLDENEYFGYSPHDVYLFQQGALPAVDGDGNILLADKGLVATSPDGHGGMIKALSRSGLLDVMKDRGVECVYYHQVDNPTAILCDPVFLGLHRSHESEMSTKVVRKVSAAEKMGVVGRVNGQTQIIEYSDLTDEQQAATDDEGELRLWAGNMAIHVFERSFLDRLTAEEEPGSDVGLKYHRAHKKVTCVDPTSGNAVQPTEPNAFKFEQFIFDALPEAANPLVMEVERAREFNPVKNAEGADSPATAKAAMAAIAKSWIAAAGSAVADGVTVEIGPRFALDAAELEQKLGHGRRFEKDELLDEPHAHEMG